MNRKGEQGDVSASAVEAIQLNPVFYCVLWSISSAVKILTHTMVNSAGQNR